MKKVILLTSILLFNNQLFCAATSSQAALENNLAGQIEQTINTQLQSANQILDVELKSNLETRYFPELNYQKETTKKLWAILSKNIDSNDQITSDPIDLKAVQEVIKEKPNLGSVIVLNPLGSIKKLIHPQVIVDQTLNKTFKKPRSFSREQIESNPHDYLQAVNSAAKLNPLNIAIYANDPHLLKLFLENTSWKIINDALFAILVNEKDSPPYQKNIMSIENRLKLLDIILNHISESDNAVIVSNPSTLVHLLKSSEHNTKILEHLLRLGADVNGRDESALTPLMAAVCVPNNIENIKKLLQYGANVNAKNDILGTVLMQSLPEYLPLLIDAGVEMEAVNRIGDTALMRLARLNNQNSIAAIKVLLDSNANIEAVNNIGETFISIINGKQKSTVEPKVEQYPDNIIDFEDGIYSSRKAIRRFYKEYYEAKFTQNIQAGSKLPLELINLAVQYTIPTADQVNPTTQLWEDLTENSLDNNQEIIDGDEIDINKIQKDILAGANLYSARSFKSLGEDLLPLNPLFFAILAGRPDLVKLFLDNQSEDAELQDKNKECIENAIHVILKINKEPGLPNAPIAYDIVLEMLKLLLNKDNVDTIFTEHKYNSETNRFYDIGKTVLSSAICYENDPQIIKFILDLGADINAVSYQNITPLMFAVQNPNEEVLKMILEKKPDLSLRDTKGRNALDYSLPQYIFKLDR